MVGWLWPLGDRAALGVSGAWGRGCRSVQLVFQGRFGVSAALLKLHVAHLALLLGLLVAGNSFCVGADLWRALWVFRELLGFAFLVMLIPVPILVMQIAAMRAGGLQQGGAL
jgi:hypothetical protein